MFLTVSMLFDMTFTVNHNDSKFSKITESSYFPRVMQFFVSTTDGKRETVLDKVFFTHHVMNTVQKSLNCSFLCVVHSLHCRKYEAFKCVCSYPKRGLSSYFAMSYFIKLQITFYHTCYLSCFMLRKIIFNMWNHGAQFKSS